MKKVNKRIVVIIFLIIGCLNMKYVNADSGWDISYNGDNNIPSSSSGIFGYGSMFGGFLLAFIGMSLGIYAVIKIMKLETKRKEMLEENNKRFNKQTKEYFNKNVNAIMKEIENKFVKIQVAYMNFDYKELKKLCSNEIYNMYHEELEKMKLNKQQNIISDFDVSEMEIIDISYHNGIVEIKCKLSLSSYNYVINTENNKVVKGSKFKDVISVYELTFITSKKKNVKKCPKCGSTVNTKTSKCDSCESVVVQDLTKIVLSDVKRND